jgi:hypothetical protein
MKSICKLWQKKYGERLEFWCKVEFPCKSKSAADGTGLKTRVLDKVSPFIYRNPLVAQNLPSRDKPKPLESFGATQMDLVHLSMSATIKGVLFKRGGKYSFKPEQAVSLKDSGWHAHKLNHPQLGHGHFPFCSQKIWSAACLFPKSTPFEACGDAIRRFCWLERSTFSAWSEFRVLFGELMHLFYLFATKYPEQNLSPTSMLPQSPEYSVRTLTSQAFIVSPVVTCFP